MPASLRIAQQIDDTEAEGPGRRFALWVQGCSLRCPGCCNPEMFGAAGGELVEVAALLARIGATSGLEGISVLGGEPFEQPGALAELCREVRQKGLSVMVYTGYRLDELGAQASAEVEALLSQIDLLVDGRFEQALPETRRRWVGSSNQRLHFLSDRYSPEDPRFFSANTVELRLVGGTGRARPGLRLPRNAFH